MAEMANAGRIDLHTHTTASDGVHAPADNVRMAGDAGLAGIAITDHDTVAGVAEAVEEGKRLGLIVVPGVEISTSSGGKDIHVLGYRIRYEDSLLLDRLAQLRQLRNQRNERIVERLGELGMPVTMEEVLQMAASGKAEDESVGRPHIAEALVRRGYVGSMKEAFDKFLGSRGSAFVPARRITSLEAVQWIHEAGGAAVLAHPGLYKDDPLVESLLSSGSFDGVEVWHSDHSAEEEARYAKLAEAYGLTATAGSDFHGLRSKEAYHGPIGNRTVDISVLAKFTEHRVRGNEQ